MLATDCAVTFFLASTLLALALSPLARRLLLKAGVVDRPNERSSHTQPTVRGGGIAIVVVFLLAGLTLALRHGDTTLLALIGATLLLALVSFLDDLRTVSRVTRFACHAACALTVIMALGVRGAPVASGASAAWVPTFVTCGLVFLSITGYINAFNFMDGINGIAAGQAFLTASATAVIAVLGGVPAEDAPILCSWAVAGAAAGFIPYNFPRARMFMGDVGSASFGFLLSSVAIWIAARYGWWLLIPLGLLHANFILDTAITLIRRVVTGQRWYEPHREHFYQRLVRSGKSHAFVTSCEMGLQLVVILLALLCVYSTEPIQLVLILLTVLLWLLFFAWCERAFNEVKRRQSLAQAVVASAAQRHE